jgi:glycosyltransferase involved in cell wall biosynthesis
VLVKIAYVTIHDPVDKTTWSGLNHYIFESLRRQGASMRPIYNFAAKADLFLKLRYHLNLLAGWSTLYNESVCYAKQYSAQIRARLEHDIDLVFAATGYGLAYLDTKKPIVIYRDSTFANLLGYYQFASNLSPRTIQEAHKVERLCLQKAELLFFASHWAADSAISFYGVDPGKVHVVPFGANLSEVPSAEDVHASVMNKRFEQLQLLFVGVDAERKGLDKAIAITENLRQLNIPARLTVVGLQKKYWSGDPDYLHHEGFLNKNNPRDFDRLVQLYANAHYLIVPSHQECYGLVYCEANAFGVPAVGTNIGGIPTIIRDGVNGWVLDRENDMPRVVNQIVAQFHSPEQYYVMGLKAREEFDTRLNWDVAGRTMMEVIRQHLFA